MIFRRMKALSAVCMAVVLGCASAMGQYFCPVEGKTLVYENTDLKENKTETFKSTIIAVSTDADGVITARAEEIHPVPDKPLAEIKTYVNYKYNPADTITTVNIMSAEDFKGYVIAMIKEELSSSGQLVSSDDFEKLEKSITAKGDLEMPLDPNAAVDSKFPNRTLRINAGMMNMTANLWKGKYLGFETITTEAGTFDCIKVSYEMTMSAMGGSEKSYVTAWYADGVGLVKATDSDKKGNVKSEQVLKSIK